MNEGALASEFYTALEAKALSMTGKAYNIMKQLKYLCKLFFTTQY
jgi:hypothetical protein